MIQYKRIGELLVERGVLSQDQLDHAIKTKLGTTLRFGEILTALGYATEADVTNALADQYGFETVDLATISPDPEALALVPSSTAVSSLVLPLAVTKNRFTCAIADPLDIPMTDSLTLLVRRPVEILLAAPSALFDAVTRAYGISPAGKRSLPMNERQTAATSFVPPQFAQVRATPEEPLDRAHAIAGPDPCTPLPPRSEGASDQSRRAKPRSKPKVDPQDDKFVLLAALSSEVPS